MRDVYLIAGPPCSGKTTFARELATDHEIVDYDEIAGGHREFSAAVEAEVQSRIHRIATDPHARAVVIPLCPGRREAAGAGRTTRRSLLSHQPRKGRVSATCSLASLRHTQSHRPVVLEVHPSRLR